MMRGGVTSRAPRTETAHALSLLSAMAAIALPVGITVTRSSQDILIGVAAAGLAALMLIALLQAMGVLGGR